MELLQIDTVTKVWAGLLGFAGFIGCIILVCSAFIWETDNTKDKLKKLIVMIICVCAVIAMFVVCGQANKLRVYTYQITDPYKVEELLNQGYKLTDRDGVIYNFTIEEPKK